MPDPTGTRTRSIRIIQAVSAAVLTLGTLAGVLRSAESEVVISIVKRQPSQRKITALSRLTNRHWENRAVDLSKQAVSLHEDLTDRYFAALNETPESVAPPKADRTARLTRGEYGVVPPVHVDKNYGFPFPQPVAPPFAVSWHEIAVDARAIHETIDQADSLLDRWTALRPGQRLTSEAGLELSMHLESYFMNVDSEVSRLSRRLRYMRSWTTSLLPASSARRDTRSDASDAETARLLAQALAGKDGSWPQLRERLLPRRVVKFKYLPARLPERHATARATGAVRSIPVRINTDVRDRAFLREFEDAVDMHWNDSSWARDRGIRFTISWERIAENPGFRDGRQELKDHISRFSGDFPALTTGGETTFVTRNVLVLGPSPVTPRTLAHEFGHLLGFEDCYLRTVSAHGPAGLFGLAILEWDNPLYGDELMCDNNVGVPIRAVW